MADFFEEVAVKYRNTPSALILFVASFVMLLFGISHFGEDIYSSYEGLLAIEQHFNLKVQIFSWTYWTMSASAQIASIVYFYAYLANTNKKWALWISLGAQTVDFLADLWYRSNGSAFTDWNATIVSALITFAFFTIGSEFFISFGGGLCLKLAAPALHSWKFYRREIERVKQSFQGVKPRRDYEENEEEKITYQPFSSKNQTKSDGFDPEILKKLGVQKGFQNHHQAGKHDKRH